MSSRNLFAILLMSGVMTVGFVGLAPAANAASTSAPNLKLGESARSHVITIRRRGHGKRLYLPIAPNYLAYDYPYYYSRGYYPTHIGPGYIYYGFPYSYYRKSYYSRYGVRSPHRRRR